MSEFNKDDVIKVATALIEDHTWFDTGDYSKDVYHCEHCTGRTDDWSSWEEVENIVHDYDCPVLAARDILTRN